MACGYQGVALALDGLVSSRRSRNVLVINLALFLGVTLSRRDQLVTVIPGKGHTPVQLHIAIRGVTISSESTLVVAVDPVMYP